ncbi:hypothetical protein TraAM80_04398 [Trypanosoma rangeli]|uniref:Uncharacterized protein n=1 Tax=Trypanosoma rangeli TaxID=5698 RepID=A0A422NJN4_TRYRA|nr:uncharacterized protein TraAM80_04398 [Trypanosoma rangeli]RNF05677.1 hypothetical protein TraAM80_04398 [Trypanosoma rangeli]|eukprot:RNF05677.1 hypothetical protein TraAM80_04398 [Trypanosoma rangeli]
MLRRSLRVMNRPKGPQGLRPGKEYRFTVPYRSEVTMLRCANYRAFNSNIRELFKKPLVQNNIKAIPRDLGELPRNYVLKLLFFHQPIRLVDLWSVCKEHDDVPLDSAKHLRLVLKIAKLQRWVYAEKNQTNNLFYYYIHQSRVQEVQDMVRADEVHKKEKESLETVEAEKLRREENERRRTVLDEKIMALQNILVSNVAQIQQFDPAFLHAKPYLTKDGAVDLAWGWRGNESSFGGDDDSSNNDSSNGMRSA